MNRTVVAIEEVSLVKRLLTEGFDATLAWLCTLFVFTDE